MRWKIPFLVLFMLLAGGFAAVAHEKERDQAVVVDADGTQQRVAEQQGTSPAGPPLPPWAKQLMPYLALGHGGFNLLVFGFFVRQGWLGFGIRQARQQGLALPLAIVRQHRQIGPLLALAAALGFLAGAGLALVHEGRLGEHPLHLAVGVVLMLVLAALYASSRRVIGSAAAVRTFHAALGLLLLLLYLAQSLLGVGILL
ncbi:MAG: DUF4079 family protein [Thermodesulfobacteriota bacterium]